MKKRNRSARNFGLRNRCIIRAGCNALKDEGASFVTQAVNSSRWRQFCNHIKIEHNIFDMREIRRTHVELYAVHLKRQQELGKLSTSTAHDYLAAVNRILEIARCDRELRVAAVGDAGFNRRRNIAEKSKATAETVHDYACSRMSPHLSAIVQLQRALGLRFEESLKIHPTKALGQALGSGRIQITAGTKGGRPREIPIISNDQINALKKAIQYQGQRRSLIPDQLNYAQFKRRCYRELKTLGITFHGERHAYANSRYQMLTGVKSPVDCGKSGREHIAELANFREVTLDEAINLDLEARLKIAEELGHSRTQITNNYLGK